MAPAIPFLGQLATSPAVPAHLRLWLPHALFAAAMARVSCIVLSSGRAAVLPGGVPQNPEWEREPPVLRLLLAAIAAAFPATGKHHLAEQGPHLVQRKPTCAPRSSRQRASDASLRRRLEATNAEIHRLRQETNGCASSSPRHLGSVEQHTSSGRRLVQALPSAAAQRRSDPAPDLTQPRQDQRPAQDLRCPSRRMRSILVDEMRPFG
jgi:hypothetical protein